MNWSKLGDVLARTVPLVGASLSGPVGIAASVGRMIAGKLGVDPDPVSIADAVRNDPSALLKLKELNTSLERAEIVARVQSQDIVNKTMRAEVAADGWFKSGWRPFIGWVFGMAIGGLFASIIYSIFKSPAVLLDQNFTSLLIWLFVAVSAILGVNIRERSRSKLGGEFQSSLSNLFGRGQER